MIAVRCPACNERVEGSNSEGLSKSIKTHFADIHKTDIDVEMNISDEDCGCGKESKSAENAAAGGNMFECPMCREDIKGSNEEEMSSRFREHLTTTHKDEPFVTRLMEKVGSRQ
jgi:predicted small metal-binding protein